MKGLLIKDYKLTTRGNSVFNVLFITVFYSALRLADLDSCSGYGGVGLIAVLYSAAVKNYDVCDNGLAYLFTLPVSRRGYVRESYLFSLIYACAMLLFYCLFDRALSVVLQLDQVPYAVFWGAMWDSFKIALLMIAFLIPFYLFFGMKRRNQYVLMVTGVILIFIVYAGSMPLYAAIEKGVRLLKRFPVTLFLLMISYVISVRIMEKKDF